MSILKSFSISPQASWEGTSPWGGGHTHETDPTRRGWRLRAVSTNLAIIGRRGKPGCISVMPISGGQFDVAWYEEDPATVDANLRQPREDRDNLDPIYVPVAAVPGWALRFIERIEANERIQISV